MITIGSAYEHRIRQIGNIIISAVFITIVFVFAILFFVVEKQTFSKIENRELASAPPALWDGSGINRAYYAELDTYYTDSFPFRDRFLAANRQIKKLYTAIAIPYEDDEYIFIAGGPADKNSNIAGSLDNQTDGFPSDGNKFTDVKKDEFISLRYLMPEVRASEAETTTYRYALDVYGNADGGANGDADGGVNGDADGGVNGDADGGVNGDSENGTNAYAGKSGSDANAYAGGNGNDEAQGDANTYAGDNGSDAQDTLPTDSRYGDVNDVTSDSSSRNGGRYVFAGEANAFNGTNGAGVADGANAAASGDSSIGGIASVNGAGIAGGKSAASGGANGAGIADATGNAASGNNAAGTNGAGIADAAASATTLKAAATAAPGTIAGNAPNASASSPAATVAPGAATGNAKLASSTASSPAATSAPSSSAESDTPAKPAPSTLAAIEYEANESTGVSIVAGQAFEVFEFSESRTAAYAATVDAIAERCGVPTYVIVPPSASELFMPEKYRTEKNEQKPALRRLSLILKNAVSINAYSEFVKAKNDYVYFRTDHHWTADGAYISYAEFAKAAGFKPVKKSDLRSGRLEGFLGSLYRQIYENRHSSLLEEEPDYVQYYYPKYDVEVVNYKDADMTEGIPGVVLKPEGDLGTNLYNVFFGGDMRLLYMHSAVANGRSVVVLRDSFGHAFLPFLANNYEHVYAVEPRYFESFPLADFISKNGIEELVILNHSLLATGKYWMDWIPQLEKFQ